METEEPIRRAIVIDDTALVAKMCGDTLRDMGYDVNVVDTAAKLDELLAQESVDAQLIVSDFNLWPGRKGNEILCRLADLLSPEQRATATFILMSGEDATEAVGTVEAMQARAMNVHFIEKPSFAAPLKKILG